MINLEILNYVKSEYGTEDSDKHLSSCMFPEKECSCPNIINYDTELLMNGFIDSFSMVSIISYLENKYDIKIPLSDQIPDNFSSVNKMIQIVNKFK